MVAHAKAMFETAELQLTVEEEDFLSKCHQWPGAGAAASLYASRLLERSLANHADALRNATAAASEHTKGLRRATWCLVVVTFLLAGATVALVFVSAGS